MPIDYKKYPPNWKSEIRPSILERANHCCEMCGVKNYAYGYRDEAGIFFEAAPEMIENIFFRLTHNLFKIVLTIAHLDHDEDNHDVQLDRLMAMCQKCHLQYDAPERARRRRERHSL